MPVNARRGKVVGSAEHPFPGTTDFSSFLLQVKASGAKIVRLANSGSDAVNCVKEAAEFVMIGPHASGKQVMTMTLFDTPLVYSTGLKISQGLIYSAPVYLGSERRAAHARKAADARAQRQLNGRKSVW